MKVHRRIVLREAAIGAGLVTAAWYLYFLVGVGGMVDYVREGLFLDYVTGPAIHVEMLVSGLGLGVILALVGYATEGTSLRRRPFGQIIFVKTVFYLAGVALVAAAVNLVLLGFIYSRAELRAIWDIMSPRLVASLAAWMVLSIVVVNFIMEVRRKVGPGKLWALLTGRYHQPREENRIFLFLDLRGSTSITETLGHARYSQFLRQVYHDLTEIVLLHDAEIYQYVGDEVVLTWPARAPDSGAQSLHAFFAFRQKLQRKKDWYRDTFGVVPEFRGGIECGEVTATEVGDIKRDIAFHGDPLNTAARLLELCGEFGEPVLVSGRIRNALAADRSLAAELRGELVLRGQSRPIPIYGVTSTAT
ncbi:MAG: adenylate/guanylate cyclase domain-containing protein [Gemmatimonadota bacterium]|jgi:adenylate cyclase